MMTQSSFITRRAFSQAVALSVGHAVLGQSAGASLMKPSKGSFAYVAASPDLGSGSIIVFKLSQAGWKSVQTLCAAAPAHLAYHPFVPVLYAVHDVDLWEHRPCGAVSAYAVDPIAGTLTLLMSQPLSLSATKPRHAILSADGNSLIVAAHGGGSYNVLPVSSDGSIGQPAIIRKEVGSMQNEAASPSRPNHLLRHPNGPFFFAADVGACTLSTFNIKDEMLGVVCRIPAQGVNQIAILPSGEMLMAVHLDGSVSTYTLDAESGRFGPATRISSPSKMKHALLAYHPSALFFVTAGTSSESSSTTLWRVGNAKEGLKRLHTLNNDGPVSHLTFSQDGGALIFAERGSGRLVGIEFNPETATFGASKTLANIEGVRSIAFQPA